MGYGVIGSPTGSGPVSLGSSPGTPAQTSRSAAARTAALLSQQSAIPGPVAACANAPGELARTAGPMARYGAGTCPAPCR
jgi:hypothetical protein